MKRFLFTLALVAAAAMMAHAQPFVRTNTATPKIQFPDIPGFHTLVADLHTHSAFSDGSVWPTVRVEEALAEGLDVISLTDHVEYHPYQKYIPENNLAGTELILNAAKNKPLIVIPGGEISATPDHFNALFIHNQSDTVLKNKVPAIRIKAAKDQGGFVFWNHPGWTSRAKDGNAPVDEGFYQLMDQGQINGIEICNGDEFWPETLTLAKKYNLTLIGNSDIHGVSHYAYTPDRHRTVTLIFAKEKTLESVREALENQRTIVYCGNYLVGTPDLLTRLLTASLQVEATYRQGTTLAILKITNQSDLDIRGRNTGQLNFHNSAYTFLLPAHATTTLMVRTNQPVTSFNLEFVAENLITGPRESLQVSLPVVIN